MKTLVKVLKVEDNTVYYAEICKKDGHVMIEDYMAEETFQAATSKDGDFGFTVITEDFPKVKKSIKLTRLASGTDLDGKPMSWGSVLMEISTSSNELMEAMAEYLDNNGWGDNNTLMGDDESIMYYVNSSDLAWFKESYKEAKKEVLKG